MPCTRGCLGPKYKYAMNLMQQERWHKAERAMLAVVESMARLDRMECFKAKVYNNLGIIRQAMARPDLAYNDFFKALGLIKAKIGDDNFFYQAVARNLARVEQEKKEIWAA